MATAARQAGISLEPTAPCCEEASGSAAGSSSSSSCSVVDSTAAAPEDDNTAGAEVSCPPTPKASKLDKVRQLLKRMSLRAVLQQAREAAAAKQRAKQEAALRWQLAQEAAAAERRIKREMKLRLHRNKVLVKGQQVVRQAQRTDIWRVNQLSGVQAAEVSEANDRKAEATRRTRSACTRMTLDAHMAATSTQLLYDAWFYIQEQALMRAQFERECKPAWQGPAPYTDHAFKFVLYPPEGLMSHRGEPWSAHKELKMNNTKKQYKIDSVWGDPYFSTLCLERCHSEGEVPLAGVLDLAMTSFLVGVNFTTPPCRRREYVTELHSRLNQPFKRDDSPVRMCDLEVAAAAAIELLEAVLEERGRRWMQRYAGVHVPERCSRPRGPVMTGLQILGTALNCV